MVNRPNSDAPVLVTGASGFIASHIVRLLLERGYRVRGTVRDPEKALGEGWLTALPGAGDRLELVKADLLADHGFDEAVAGCEFVIHTASPYVIDVKDPQKDLVDPAVKGTTSVLESCRHAGNVRRVVLTSSVAAITDEANGHISTEDDWNTKSSLTRNPYYYSKTLAEKAAWDFMDREDLGFDLVAVNPFYVIGPSLVASLNTSHTFFTGFTNGRFPGILAIEWPFVDVRDVALAHVEAMETDTAHGRYIVASETRTMRQVIDLLRENGWAERYKLPSMSFDRGLGIPMSRFLMNFLPLGMRTYMKNQLGGSMQVDNSKASAELGLKFRDVDQTILETMEDLERWGHLGKR